MTKPTTAQVLEHARELIQHEGSWCRGSMARVKGLACEVDEPAADTFCLLGAVFRTYYEMEVEVEPSCLRTPDAAALHSVVGMNVTNFNDASAHVEVLAALDKAIDMAEERGI